MIEEELKNRIQVEIPELNVKDINLIVEGFCRITQPKIQNPSMELITVYSTRKRGNSIKPVNIFLDMKGLLIDSSEIGLTVAGVAAKPYLLPLVALTILN